MGIYIGQQLFKQKVIGRIWLPAQSPPLWWWFFKPCIVSYYSLRCNQPGECSFKGKIRNKSCFKTPWNSILYFPFEFFPMWLRQKTTKHEHVIKYNMQKICQLNYFSWKQSLLHKLAPYFFNKEVPCHILKKTLVASLYQAKQTCRWRAPTQPPFQWIHCSIQFAVSRSPVMPQSTFICPTYLVNEQHFTRFNIYIIYVTYVHVTKQPETNNQQIIHESQT